METRARRETGRLGDAVLTPEEMLLVQIAALLNGHSANMYGARVAAKGGVELARSFIEACRAELNPPAVEPVDLSNEAEEDDDV